MRKTKRQIQRAARRLLGLCIVDGIVDERRARLVVERLLAGGHAPSLALASRFQRLLRQDRAAHTAEVASAIPLPAGIRSEIEHGLVRLYGPGIVASFVEDPSLLGGVRLRAGSDVYDGSIKGSLAALENRFDHAA